MEKVSISHAVKDFIQELPPLPIAFMRIMEVTRNMNSTASELQKVISLDPVLTGRLLQLVNSAHTGMRSNVTSIVQAIVLLGLNTVKNMAIATSVISSLNADHLFKAFSAEDFWEHSIRTGICARAIARHLKVNKKDLETYFVAGLLHDIGKIALNSIFAEKYIKLFELMLQQPDAGIYQYEPKVFETDHCAATQVLAEEWQLPPSIANTMRYHHCSLEEELKEEEEMEIVRTVALANSFCNSHWNDAPNLGGSNTFDKSLSNYYNIDETELIDKIEEMHQEVIEAKNFLQMN